MQQFIAGLKSRSEDVRHKAARDLHHYVKIFIKNASIMIWNVFLTGDIRVT